MTIYILQQAATFGNGEQGNWNDINAYRTHDDAWAAYERLENMWEEMPLENKPIFQISKINLY